MGSRSKNSNNKVAQRSTAAVSSITAASYYGPIPPASEMAHYDEIHPGMANRIMLLAENQSTHRQKIESQAVKSNCVVSILGVCFAFIIAMSTLALAAYCFYLDKNGIGAFMGSFGLVSVVGAFIYGTRSNRQERREKWDKAQQNK